VIGRSTSLPSEDQIDHALPLFQGKIKQTPPMFSAKKCKGKRLYELARKGQTVERAPVEVSVDIKKLFYRAPELGIRVRCSKGTYIRAIAHDLGKILGCGAHLKQLTRIRSGCYTLKDCFDGHLFHTAEFDLSQLKEKMIRSVDRS